MTNRDLARTRLVLALLNPRSTCHRATIRGAEAVPRTGAAVLVSNHGRLDFDFFILIRLLLRERGRLVRLMADHLWFTLPVTKRLFAAAGAVDGTRANAARLLASGGLILAYPGGVREIMNSHFGREHIDWRGRRGFARLALEAQVPVIPIAGIGVNNGLVFVSSGRWLGKLLFQRILRMGPKYADYRVPLAMGLLPLPLPYPLVIPLPLPCRVTYVVGEPILPPPAERADAGGGVSERQVDIFARQVERAMVRLIAEHGRHPTLRTGNPR